MDEPFLEEIRAWLPELVLQRCAQCGTLWSADGRQDQSRLLEAYSRIPDVYFGKEALDTRYACFYAKLAQILEQRGPRTPRVLDVGCGDGRFLASLPSGWQKYGIEPSRSGAAAGQSRGLDVQCGALETCPHPSQVDVVVALDVIEHLVHPAELIEATKRRLAPGGLLMLVTGDANSLTARVADDRWSYLRWSGHVAVFSAVGLRALLVQAGLEILDWRRCDHPASSGVAAWMRVALLEPLRRVLGRPRSWYPFWSDHQVVIARRT